MATKDRTALKDEFKNGNLATGERFAELIDSMKVVQDPVADPAASGTSLSFIDSISQDADGKITATKKTLDLENAHELNPFKGWYKTGDTLPTDGFDGAYLYFKDTSEQTGLTTIYRWNGTTYADTGTVVDTSNVQTFETGQAVNGVAIDGNGIVNPTDNALAKAGDVMGLKAKLEGVTAVEEKQAVETHYGYVNGITGEISDNYSSTTYRYATFTLPEGAKRVRFQGIVYATSSSAGYAFYKANGDLIEAKTYTGGAAVTTTKEYVEKVPDGAATFKTCVRIGAGGVVNVDNFYCFIQVGSSAADLVDEAVKGLTGLINKPNPVVGKMVEPMYQGVVSKLFPSSNGDYIAEGTNTSIKTAYVWLDAGKSVMVESGAYAGGSISLFTTGVKPAQNVQYANLEKFDVSLGMSIVRKYDTGLYVCVCYNVSTVLSVTFGEVADMDVADVFEVKRQPVVKQLTLSSNYNYFVSQSTHRTKYLELRAGDKIKVKVGVADGSTAYIQYGLAPINNPPKVMSSTDDMANYTILGQYYTGSAEIEYTASGDVCFWICFKLADIRWVTVYSISDVSDVLHRVVSKSPLIGSPRFHFSQEVSMDDSTDLTEVSVSDIYDAYDALVTANPMWLARETAIGTSTSGDFAIRHYVMRYMDPTLMYGYLNPETESNNHFFDDGGLNRDLPHVVINAGVHGNERAAVYGLLKAVKEIVESTDEWAMYIKTNFVVDIIPIASPDGYNNNEREVDDVDPNRDFDNFVLAESRALRDFMLGVHHPIAFIDCHNTNNNTYGNKKRMFLAIPKNTNHMQQAVELSARLSSYMEQSIAATQYPYSPSHKLWFSVNETEGDQKATLAWFMTELFGIMAFTMETPRNTAYDDDSITKCTAKASILMSTLIENVVPALGGLVL